MRRGRRLWLTAVGRHRHSEAQQKHLIERIDRRLGNASISAERVG
jgi:hypothetical protein